MGLFKIGESLDRKYYNMDKKKTMRCTCCKNREFSKTTGIICSLTKLKPTSIEGCEDYVADESALKIQDQQREGAEKSHKYRYWKALGIGCSIGIVSAALSGVSFIIAALETGISFVVCLFIFDLIRKKMDNK